MHICFITPELPPYITGGAGVATLNFAKTLVKKGFKVTIVTRRLVSDKNFEYMDGVRVYRLNCTRIRKPFPISHLLFTLKALSLAKRINHEIDLYYAQTFISPGYITSLLRKNTGKPTIVHGRGIDVERLYKGQKKRLSLKVLKDNTYVFMLSHDHVSKVKQIFKTEGIDKDVFLLTNGINVDFKKSRLECRKILGFSDDMFHLVYVGRVDRPKGLIYAVKAVKDVKDAVLHIVGEETAGRTEVTDELMNFVSEHNLKDRVLFHGRQERDMVYTFDKASDAFIYPLLIAAGMGNSVLEAMYLGTPVIGTDIGYFPELIKNMVSGILVKPRDPDGIKNAIKHLKDLKIRKSIIKNASEFVHKNHDWNSIADKFIKFLKNEILPK